MARAFALLREAALLWSCTIVGNAIVAAVHVPIPGSIAGFALVAVLLGLGLIPLAWFGVADRRLVAHMSLFFVPAAAGIVTCTVLLAHLGAYALVLAASAAGGIVAAAAMTAAIAREPVTSG